jgi:hypothetical protein
LRDVDSAISDQLRADAPASQEKAYGPSTLTDHAGSPLHTGRKELTRTANLDRVQFPHKVEQLRKAEPVLKRLYQELFDQDRKSEADAVFVTLVWLRTTLVAEEQRLDACR